MKDAFQATPGVNTNTSNAHTTGSLHSGKGMLAPACFSEKGSSERKVSLCNEEAKEEELCTVKELCLCPLVVLAKENHSGPFKMQSNWYNRPIASDSGRGGGESYIRNF